MGRKLSALLIAIYLTILCSTIAFGQETKKAWDCGYRESHQEAAARKKEAKRNGGIYDPNFPAHVTALTLDIWEVIAGDGDLRVKASTAYEDPEGDVVTFVYRVSAGKIVGAGANVVWDLTGIGPGTYTITAGVGDGHGICEDETKTRRFEILACAGCMLRETE